MMQRLLTITFILVIQILVFPQASSNIWYVSTTGSGSQTGTDRGNAWSLSSMNQNLLQPGDFVYFKQGTYTDRLEPTKSGTTNALITWMADPINTDTVWFSVPVSAYNQCIYIKNVSYIRLKNIGTQHSRGGINIYNDANVIYLDSLTVHKYTHGALGISGNVYAANPSVNGIDSIFVRWCVMKSDSQVAAQSDVIVLRAVNNIFIMGNYLDQINNTGVDHNDVMQALHLIGNVYIWNNLMINRKDSHSQMMMYNMSNIGYKTVLYNNVQIHKGAVGTGVAFDVAVGPGNSSIEPGEIYAIHNTMVGNWSQNFHVTEPAIIKNNILYTSSNGSGVLTVKHPFLLGTNDIDYNMYYCGGGTTYLYRENAAYVRTLDWMQAKGVSANDFATTNPLFTNFANDDLTLQTGSPGENAGTDLQALIESWNIEGVEWKSFDNPYVPWSNPVLRGSNPTVGAWEFGGGSGGNFPPYSPANPNPSNGATAQPLNLTMTWTCSDPDGDPLTYDVYFGTGTNPPLFLSNQSNASFNPGNLNTNTIYYWRIIAKDNQGHSTSGALWNFATIIVDVTPPEVVSAALLDSLTLNIIFSEPLEQSGAQNTGNYSITNGINILTASLSGSEVTLTTSAHSPGTYTVTVNNVTDLSGNVISQTANIANYEWTIAPQNPVKLEIITVVASSTNDPNYPPEKTIDGLGIYQDPNSRWAAIPMPQYLIFDLGSEKEFMQTRFSFFGFNSGRIYTYTVLATNDTNSTWTLVLDNVQSVLDEWTIENFSNISARFMKLIFITSNQSTPGQEYAHLWEAEIWGLDGVTPVELTSFIASYTDGKVNLEWVTSSETNCYGFAVQRRSENSSYSQIGFVNGSGTTTNRQTYNFTDQDITDSKYFYRLKELSHNGDFSYSQEIMIDIPHLSSFELQQNYPNPFNPSTNIAVRLPYKTNIRLAVYNMLGELIVEVVNGEYDSGTHIFNFEADELTSGIYFYRLESQGFADTKKMILLR